MTSENTAAKSTLTQRKKARKARKTRVLRPKAGECLATVERQKQQGGVVKTIIADGNALKRKLYCHKATCECKLDVYCRAGKITAVQKSAGIRYRTAYLSAVKGIPTRDSTQPFIAGGAGENPLDRKTDAEKTLDQAHAVLSLSQSTLIRAVCGEDEVAGDEKRLRTFVRGLEALVTLWGPL